MPKVTKKGGRLSLKNCHLKNKVGLLYMSISSGKKGKKNSEVKKKDNCHKSPKSSPLYPNVTKIHRMFCMFWMFIISYFNFNI